MWSKQNAREYQTKKKTARFKERSNRQISKGKRTQKRIETGSGTREKKSNIDRDGLISYEQQCVGTRPRSLVVRYARPYNRRRPRPRLIVGRPPRRRRPDRYVTARLPTNRPPARWKRNRCTGRATGRRRRRTRTSERKRRRRTTRAGARRPSRAGPFTRRFTDAATGRRRTADRDGEQRTVLRELTITMYERD